MATRARGHNGQYYYHLPLTQYSTSTDFGRPAPSVDYLTHVSGIATTQQQLIPDTTPAIAKSQSLTVIIAATYRRAFNILKMRREGRKKRGEAPPSSPARPQESKERTAKKVS
jgi:hypothetical protein